MQLQYGQHYNASEQIKRRAKILRRSLTPAEKRFWYYARNRKILGLKFRRQHPLGKYIVDFYCHELKLVIEIDGSIHNLEHIKKSDREREMIIRELGLKVLRFSNDDVFTNPHLIEEKITKILLLKEEGGPASEAG